MNRIGKRELARCALVLFLLLGLFEAVLAQYGSRRRYPSPWTEMESPVKGTLHRIHFHDNQRGWILADSSGILLGTRDGGATWSIEAELEPGYYEALTTTKDGTLWIAGDGGRLYAREVNGERFVRRGALRAEFAFYDLLPVYTLEDSARLHRLFMGGMDQRGGTMKPLLGRSDTRGRSWEMMGGEIGGPAVAALGRSPQGFLLAASGGGIFSSLTGSPGSWIAIHNEPGSGSLIRDLEIDPETNDGMNFALAVGHDGLVLVSFNGGRNWTRSNPFTANRLRRAQIVNGQSAIVVGDIAAGPGACWRTSDRAASWQMVQLPYNDIALRDVTATDTALFAVGTGGTILTMPK